MKNYKVLLLFMFLTFSARAQEGSSSMDPIVVGTLEFGTNYSDTHYNVDYDLNPTWFAGDVIVYSFSVDEGCVVDISTCGSVVSTKLELYEVIDETEQLIAVNNGYGAICSGNSASLRSYLKTGDYMVFVNATDYFDPGIFTINIGLSAIKLGANIVNAVGAGLFDYCEGGSFTNSRNNGPTNGYANDIGEASDDIYYFFDIKSVSTVSISHAGSTIDSYLHLLDASGNSIASNDNDGPLIAGSAASIQTVLQPGLYYIVSEGKGTSSGDILTSLTILPNGPAPAGADLSNAIDAGTLVVGVPFINYETPNDCHGDDIGDYGNDVFYKFTLDYTSDVDISNCLSISPFNSLYLLDQSGNEITRAEFSGPLCSEFRASIQTTLSAGVYYVAVEDYFIPSFNVRTSITVTKAIIPGCSELAATVSQDQNYVISYIPRKPFNTESTFNTANVCELQQIVQYYDGLGRPVQTVQIKGNQYGTKDLIQPVAYDMFGRESIKYLPYTSGGDAGSYRSNALIGTSGYSNSAQKNFYSLTGQGYRDIASPYAVTIFEHSSLSRVLEQGAPGDTWQPVLGSGNGHTIKTEYGTNLVGEVKLWTIYNNTASAGTYQAGKLYKTVLKNENWVPTDLKAGTVEEFKDLKGRLVLKRIWENSSKNLSTYYLYDKFGNLRYVLPPAVNEGASTEINSFDETQQVFDYFIYAYHYDGNNRVVEKKIPGKGWEETVYNKLDQVILTRDAEQRNNNVWLFNKYDALGRIVITGIINSSTNRHAWQNSIDLQSSFWEVRDNANSSATGTGYTNNVLPTDNYVLHYHNISYYDDYNFYGNSHSGPLTGESTAVNSLPTGSKINVLNNNTTKLSTMLLGTSYYDGDGKVVRTKSQNHLVNGTDEVLNVWNFAKELTSSVRTHKADGSTTTVVNEYEFDHLGKKKITKVRINGGDNIVLSRFSYNEIGQLLTKDLHSLDSGISFLQSMQYSYNERGWLKSNISNEFSFNLKYEDGTVPRYNGNIANQEWGIAYPYPNVYTYNYDKLDRLISGASTGTTMSETLTYNEMGNIQSMDRDALGISSYDYNGNRLSKISTGPLATANYVYDVNGNAILDGRSGISLSYNVLNLPATAIKAGVVNVAYTYDATGDKLRKVSGGVTREYVSGIEYINGDIDVIHTEEGVARNNGGTYSYEYNLADHLGNVRYSFNSHPTTGQIQRLQSDDYYVFGKRKSVSPVSLNNKYLYNGKEIQDELNSAGEGGQYDYGARFYDPVIARWNVIDKMSEKYYNFSTYNYAFNNPVNFIDPDGNDPTQYQQKLIDKGYQLMFYRMDASAGKYGPIAQSAEFYRQYYLDVREDAFNQFFRHAGRYPQTGGAGRNASSFGAVFQKMAGALIGFTPFGAIGAATKAGRQGNIPAGILAGLSFFGQMSALVSFGGTAGVASGEASTISAANARTTAVATYYPPNGGALGEWTNTMAKPGQLMDRFGSIYGMYASPVGTPFTMRALPSAVYNDPYKMEVLKSFPMKSSTIAPGFGQIGLGIQYKMPVPIKYLVEYNYLKIYK